MSTADIRRLLDQAHHHDTEAQRCRREAGALLAELRALDAHQYHLMVHELCLDQRTADLLVSMAAAGRVRTCLRK